ncbi:MAG: phospholipase D-like domain-containing protein [Rhodoblastus sp.]
MKRTLAFALALALASPAAAARLEIHYAPEENLEKVDVALIDGAKSSIDMAAYVLTDVAVIDAIGRAAGRGVKVRLFLEPNQEHGGGYAAAAREKLLATPGVETKRNPRSAWMHLKSYVVDGALLRMGAANLSASGLKQQDNDLLITDDAGLVGRFGAHFERMWGR